MFDGLMYFFILLSLICTALMLYNILKMYLTKKAAKLTNNITSRAVGMTEGGVGKKLARKQGGIIKSTLRVTSEIKVKFAVVQAVVFGLLAGLFAILAFCFCMMGLQSKGVVSVMLMSKEKSDCICYVRCTGDTSLDSKCPYETLFGATEFEKLVGTIYTSKSEITTLMSNTNSKEVSDEIIGLLGNEGYNCYREIIINNKNFRKKDGVNRKHLSGNDLEEDLKKLLLDCKENGINPDCPCCGDGSTSNCIGELPYNGEFSWTKEAAQNNSNNAGNGMSGLVSGSGKKKLGTATGQYAITLSDGNSYYFYHQKVGCGCVYCGNWSNIGWGDNGWSYYFSTNGCAVFSLAMIVSNLLGREVTPLDLLQDLGCTISTDSKGRKYVNTHNSSSFSGILIVRPTVVESIKKKYGIDYKVATSADEASKAFSNDLADTMLWTQWVNNENLNGTAGDNHEGGLKWYYGDGHFMAVRKETDEPARSSNISWYCLTSCGTYGGPGEAAVDYTTIMNTGESPVNVMRKKNGTLYVLWVDTPLDINNGGGVSGTGSSTGSAQLYDQVAGAKIYDNNPVAGAYRIVDVESVAEGIYDETGWWTYEFMSRGHYVPGHKGYSYWMHSYVNFSVQYINGSTCDGKFGFPLVAVGARVMNPDRTVGSTIKESGAEMKYGSVIVAVLERDGKDYYMPAIVDDCKAHSWPEFIVQTGYFINADQGKSGPVYYYRTNNTIDKTDYSQKGVNMKDAKVWGNISIEFCETDVYDSKGNNTNPLGGLNKYRIKQILVYDMK